MQKLLNAPSAFVDEVVEGVLLAHSDRLRAVPGEPRAVVRADAPIAGKVAIATGGGSGHLPVFLGYVGQGLATGCAVGNLFASPSTDQMVAVTRAIDGGAGVLYLYGNYGGDRLNFDAAAEAVAEYGIHVQTVLVNDDVASAPLSRAAQRRGIAGIFFAYKIAGAAAESGADLDSVRLAAEHAVRNTRTMGVALAPCTLPTVGRPTFELPSGQMEIGMGIHGEPGVSRGPLKTADEVADDLLDRILEDLRPPADSALAILVNGLGATPTEELYLLYRRAHRGLTARGLRVRRAYIGEYATSLEMAGASISIMVLDDQLAALLDAPADAPLLCKL